MRRTKRQTGRRLAIFSTLALSFAASTFALSGSAVAGTPLPNRFELRQLIQAEHITDAKEDGRLSGADVSALQDEQARIKDRLAVFASDGRINDRETAVLDYLLDCSSRHFDVVTAGDRDAKPTRTARADRRKRR